MNGPVAEKLTAALRYSRHGWPVFVLSSSKVPLANCDACRYADNTHDAEACSCLTCHGFKAATTDDGRIAEMVCRHPSGLLALRTGAASGTVVVDIDPRHDGITTMEVLDRQGLLPGTANVCTGSDGLHCYYAHPGGTVSSGANKLGPGVDVKADLAYVVLPPSRHPSTGLRYRWIGPDDVFAEPLTPLPVPLMERLRPPERPTVRFHPPASMSQKSISRRLTALVDFVLQAGPSERNQRLFWASCRAAELLGAVPQDVIVGALTEAARAVGLTDTEIGDGQNKGTIASGLHKRAAA